MPTLNHHPTATRQRLKVFIDCADITINADTLSFSKTGIESHDTVTAVLRWIESCPNRSELEVHLNTGRKSEPSRRLQRRLQTLGCRVVAKYYMPTTT